MTAGFTVWLTGLSGSGKSSIAESLASALEARARTVDVLDGDVVRRHLSKGLGFSREDRDANIERIAWVASRLTRLGGAVIVAAISPYEAARRTARALVEPHGAFIEVHVATPLTVCESRDPKGLYARARAGELKGFTGIDDPYEPPPRPDLTLDTTSRPPEGCAALVLAELERRRLT